MLMDVFNIVDPPPGEGPGKGTDVPPVDITQVTPDLQVTSPSQSAHVHLTTLNSVIEVEVEVGISIGVVIGTSDPSLVPEHHLQGATRRTESQSQRTGSIKRSKLRRRKSIISSNWKQPFPTRRRNGGKRKS